MVTPDQQVGRSFVDAPGVTGHAGVGARIGQVGGAYQQAAGLQQGEPGQLDRAAGQDAFACAARESEGEEREEEAGKKCQGNKEEGEADVSQSRCLTVASPRAA